MSLVKEASGRAWIILILATAATILMQSNGFVGWVAGLFTLSVAYLKARLVILDFMDLRRGPRAWRYLLEAWLALITIVIVSGYCTGADRNVVLGHFVQAMATSAP